MAPPAQRGFSPNSTRVSETLWNSLTYFAATLGVAVSMQNQARSANKLALLGVRDDLQLRDALQRYIDASKLHLRLDNALTVESARARAQDALEQVSHARDPQRVSQVLTLLGILAYRASASGGAQSQVDAAISDFTDAVRDDPANEQAAYDLELLLRLTAARGSRVEPGQGGGFGRTGRRGAGGGQPGSGY